MTIEIHDLADRPEWFDTVAGWLHAQWWAARGASPADVVRALAPHLGPDPLPATFVATVEGQAAGTASLILSETPDRPACRPSLAALFVMPGYRRRGIGRLLVRTVERRVAIDLGGERLFLNTVEKADYYRALGWREQEIDYDGRGTTIMRRDLAG